MLSGAVIMITRSHSARDGASRLIMPVLMDSAGPGSWPGGNDAAHAGHIQTAARSAALGLDDSAPGSVRAAPGSA
jgi:hypothetical protein